MKYLLFFLSIALSSQLAAAKVGFAVDGLPSIGDPANLIMSAREEYKIGQELVTQLHRELPISDDVELNYYLQNLGTRLLNEVSEQHFPFNFLILESPIVNAFAAPGGIIVVHTGLIELAENEDELAAVLAHEIAHVTQRHLARFYEKSNKIDIGTTLGILAAIIASAHSPAAGQAALYTGLAASASAKIGFTRSHEQEADRIGRSILSRAGYNTEAMGDFFARLREQSFNDEENAIEFLSTHPLPSSRIADQFYLHAEQSSEEKLSRSSLKFNIFRARTKGLSQGLLTHQNATPAEQDAVIYARAVALIQNNRPRDAQKLSKSLSQKWKNSPSGQLLAGTALTNSRQLDKSIPLLESMVRNYPQHPAAREALANAYLAANKGKEAYYLLNNWELDSSNWLPLLKLKAAAASKSGRQAMSHAMMAAYYVKTGLPSAALAQIEIAEHLPTTSKITKARLDLLKAQLKKIDKYNNP